MVYMDFNNIDSKGTFTTRTTTILASTPRDNISTQCSYVYHVILNIFTFGWIKFGCQNFNHSAWKKKCKSYSNCPANTFSLCFYSFWLFKTKKTNYNLRGMLEQCYGRIMLENMFMNVNFLVIKCSWLTKNKYKNE